MYDPVFTAIFFSVIVCLLFLYFWCNIVYSIHICTCIFISGSIVCVRKDISVF